MWGCGGNLTAAEFSPMVRQYATFLRDSGGPKIIAGGATGDDYDWTKEIVGNARGNIDAISLHYYTLPTGNWDKKGPAIGFDEAAWNATFARTRALETYIRGHDEEMDKHDKDNKIGLMVAEWGTWYDATPGTNAAFLQQENTLRDALVAATNFHIFHRHADRVHMANIAQMVNVLQAMILTDGPRMTLTPTYHAFMLYQPFQGAQALPVSVSTQGTFQGERGFPAVDVTAARGTDGRVHIGLVNADPDEQADVEIDLGATNSGALNGQVLTAPRTDSRNTFDQPNEVVPTAFSNARWRNGKLHVTMPAKSVVVLSVR
jgi:alpha-N-arabinofuranosidase